MNGRRFWLRRVAALGLLGAANAAGLVCEVLAAGNRPIVPGMQKLSGKVWVNGQPAHEGMSVGSGDTIVTGAGSEAIYVINQDAFLQRENSSVSFFGATADVMRVLTGKILSVFGKGPKKLQTATATIGIRGTGCYIESEVERVYFCLCYGTAEVVPNADPSHVEHFETKHHEHPVYLYRDSAQPMMVQAELINHSDAELELLEALVGRWPPFEKPYY